MVEHIEKVVYVERIDCPECGGEAEQGAPDNWLVPGEPPRYRHTDEKTGLCPVMTAAGYKPADPVEHAVSVEHTDAVEVGE
jgi:hypothetical protein